MGQRTSTLTQILGIPGWKIDKTFFEWKTVESDDAVVRVDTRLNPNPSPWTMRLILQISRRLTARCGNCGERCSHRHSGTKVRRWLDLSWAGFEVWLEYAPIRVRCDRCIQTTVEMLPFADPYQHETRRFQQHLTVQAASMPTLHVAAMHGLCWSTVRRIELQAITRWEASRPTKLLRFVGIDEKYLGRRGHYENEEHFVTIVSDLETGEPVWIGYGRNEATVKSWLDALSKEQKDAIQLFAMDMHEPFWNAIDNDPQLDHAAISHDPFHVIKRANEALDELRRQVFFRAGEELRGIGRGTRWLFLRAWERCTSSGKKKLRELLSYNRQLACAYQVKEELRSVLAAPDRASMEVGLKHILCRTQRRANGPLRKLHDSLVYHQEEILTFGEYRPSVGRIEALNNNWETLVRRARGYRDHDYLMRKLRFMTANPIRTGDGLRRFLALGDPALPTHMAKAA
jgi:transposase